MSPLVILQPTGSKKAREHYVDTIENLVDLKSVERFLEPDIFKALTDVHVNGKAAMWGVVPGVTSQAFTKWQRINSGDIVLFAENKKIKSQGSIAHKFVSKELAKHLWGIDEDAQTWELMYSLVDVTPLDLTYEEFNKVVDYKENYIIQGFTVMDESRSNAYLSHQFPDDYTRRPEASRQPKDSFGEIPGFPEGSVFATREELRMAGLHSKPVDGISCIFGNPADAIVLSGGYTGDLDNGDYILYTGQGGRDPKTKKQISNQVLEKGNLGLMKSKDLGIPIRVIRGSEHKSKFSPTSGYRYDGLFTIEDAFTEESEDGPWIWRFQLKKVANEEIESWENTTSIAEINQKNLVAPIGNATPERKSSGVQQRIVRNTKITKYVKEIYRNKCQFCEITLMTNSGGYSEGAHIRPLGGTHKGSDTTENVLCLCANCHTLFDKGALYVEEKSLTIKSTVDANFLKSLSVVELHQINADNLAYHRVHIAGVHNEN